MTQEERRERAEQRRAARAAQWETEQTDRALMIDVLRDVMRDKTCNPAQRLFAVTVLDYAKSYHLVPSGLKFPDSRDDSDMTRLRARFAAELKKAAEDNT